MGTASRPLGVPPAEIEEKERKEDVEEDADAKKRSIAWGAASAAAAYGAIRVAAGDSSSAEDLVDLLHSAYTSSVAVRGITSLESNAQHIVALPRSLASGDGQVVRMFCHSLGYFFADVALIAVKGPLLGRWPELWAGRLAHHAIQTVANVPCIFRTGPSESKALRSVLCIAYFAEFSNIFLRLSNLLRKRNVAAPRLRQIVNWALLVSFGASRLVNFWAAIRIFWKARPLIDPRIFQAMSGIQASGYLLNLVWFFKIAKIVAKPAAIPSLEC